MRGCAPRRARPRNLGCAQNEDLSETLDLSCLSSSRSGDPSGREGGDLASCRGGRVSAPRKRMGAQSVAPKSTQMVLHQFARLRVPHAHRRDLGCAQNEDLSETLDLICLSLSRSKDPSGRKGERVLLTKVAKKWGHEGRREKEIRPHLYRFRGKNA